MITFEPMNRDLNPDKGNHKVPFHTILIILTL
nr:MAG TPA: hypothetical protein [Caudoviricetes sp.]